MKGKFMDSFMWMGELDDESPAKPQEMWTEANKEYQAYVIKDNPVIWDNGWLS